MLEAQAAGGGRTCDGRNLFQYSRLTLRFRDCLCDHKRVIKVKIFIKLMFCCRNAYEEDGGVWGDASYGREDDAGVVSGTTHCDLTGGASRPQAVMTNSLASDL